jgi:hypothetical protein
MDRPPPPDALRGLTRRIHAHLSQENKRRNLVGEGFEDVIAAVVSRLTGAASLQIRNRAVLHDLPGFHAAAPNEKIKKVDLAILGEGQRTLVSAKWSIRADREEQFLSDFEAYARLESAGQNFAYTLITNEFDGARLKAACERRRQNGLLFTQVVHLNPLGVLAAYGDSGQWPWAIPAPMVGSLLLSVAQRCVAHSPAGKNSLWAPFSMVWLAPLPAEWGHIIQVPPEVAQHCFRLFPY